jgi:hypothetical protein
MRSISLAVLALPVLVLAADPPKADDPRVPLAVARDRADVMHEVYAETLEVVHHRYFRRDGAVLPARALEDVFARIDRKSGVKASWIAVNTPAMSVDHQPKTDFEKKAAEEIAKGKEQYTAVEKGYYLRAGAIPLGSGCVTCHLGLSAADNKTPRFAGLVIAIPVKGE